MNPIETQEQTMDISEDNEPIFEDYDNETSYYIANMTRRLGGIYNELMMMN